MILSWAITIAVKTTTGISGCNLLLSGSHTTSNELGLNVSRALNDKTSVTAGVSTYLYDVAYANQGDTFYTLDLAHQINDKLGAHVGAAGGYFNDEGKYEGNEATLPNSMLSVMQLLD